MKKIKQTSIVLGRVNTLLVILIIVINLYTLSLPIIPFFKQLLAPNISSSLYQKKSITRQELKRNLLVIPSIKLKKPIHDGSTFATANKGIWRLPYTSTPDQGSNTVMIGHRFSYIHPEAGVFYSLDQIQNGDDIYVTYNKKAYHYVVQSIKEVEPTEISVERPTDNAILTLYTCTPLWTSTHRLVVQATLKEGYGAA